MCGIVAVLGNITFKEEKIFEQLLEVDSLRGRHSTGVIKVTDDRVVSTKKKAVDGVDFVKLESKWIRQGNNRVLIGHNRWATKGAVNDVNAHPFTHGHIHGVHNGTLTTQYGLKDYTKFEVDSDNIFYNIEHEGVDKTVEKLKGAFAIAMYDEDKCQVNIFRNSERELGMAVLNGGRTIVLASEYMMLKWVLDRNDVPEKDYQLIKLIDTYKKITLKPFALDKKNIRKAIGATAVVTELKKPVVVARPAQPAITPLSKYGLNAKTYYPMEVVSWTMKSAQHMQLIAEMMVAPYTKIAINAHGESPITNLKNIIEKGKNMFESKINQRYGTSSAPKDCEFIAYSCDYRPLSDEGRNLMAEEEKANRELEQELEELKKEGTNVVPFL